MIIIFERSILGKISAWDRYITVYNADTDPGGKKFIKKIFQQISNQSFTTFMTKNYDKLENNSKKMSKMNGNCLRL